MGVPKFDRFIRDRYPCSSKIVKENEIPQYDNLYLDMNSIIHNCSHPSDSDIHFRIGKKEFSDEDIFQNVCRYVEIVFSIVKPIELMYLAFDGVAPRAKMNQQRGHRFRMAKDINEAVLKNEVLTYDKIFDANCITTGTVFMSELIDHIKHFVAYKISTDPAWQKSKIIVSGSEVPGEGEHKIMEYIRFNKAQPNYNPNTRHCLYCLDADLIILGLCTHEPHFSLIREKVTFGKRMNMLTPEESDFELLHLSLLREYLEYEFTPIKSKLKFPFDLEKIIDDYVLIGFLVGNDFIPQLPNLNIVHGALPLLYQTYMKVLPTLNGYINECGELNVTRFETYLQMISKFVTNQSEPCKIPEFLVNESGPKNNSSKIEAPIDIRPSEETSKNKDVESRRNFIENAFKVHIQKCEGKQKEPLEKEEISLLKTNVTDENDQKVLSKSLISKSCMEDYYKNKFKFDQIDRIKILAIVEQYIKAIQWTLRYYYQGCCSWSWYYPYHYAPLISDLKELQDITFDFTMGVPFTPLQHLLAVLPPANLHLLPNPLQCLLTNQNSAIIDFYPKDFEVDLNGKTNDWESIVLIPFIDENKLIAAMEPYMTNLSFKERKRNRNGLTFIFTYTKSSLGQYPVETILGSFVNHAQLELINVDDMVLPKNQLIQGLCRNVSLNLSFSGFPTLKHVDHSFTFAKTPSKFNTHQQTKIESMILYVAPKPANELEDLAKEFLGQKVYAYWPYLQEAFVIGVTDFKKKIILKNFWKGYNEDNVKIDELPKSALGNLHKHEKLISAMYKNTFGIVIGETNILFYIFSTIGQKYTCGNDGKVQLQMKWSPSSKVFPYQLIVKDEKIKRYRFILYKSINELFIISSTCFMISQPNYGAKGKIQNVIGTKQLISIVLELSEEPDFLSISTDGFATATTYMTCKDVANKLKLCSTLISRITGSLIVTEEPLTSKYHDIGLRIKIPKHEKELFGYTKKVNEYWSYSEKAVELIHSYISEFPYLFENLSKSIKDTNSSTFAISDLFPDGLSQLNLLKVWLSEQKNHYTTFLECHTQTLGFNGVSTLEKEIVEFYSKEHKQILTSIEVKPQSLFIPGTLMGLVPPDFKAEHSLLDRVVCVRDSFTVPLGLKGTIIGIQEKEEKCKNVYEVLFDSSFTGGLTLYESSEHRCYRLMGTDFINISFGKRDVLKSRRVKVDTPSKMTRNNNNNKSNNAIRNQTNNSNTNNYIGNKSSSTSKTSKVNTQDKKYNNRMKKTHTLLANTKESIDYKENQPNKSDSKIDPPKTNNDKSRKMKHYPKRQSKTMPTESSVPNDIDNSKQIEMVGEKLNETPVNVPQSTNTGTRRKEPFNKTFQGQKNQHRRNTNLKKNTISGINKPKIVKQCQSSKPLHDPDTDKKSYDAKEDKK